MEILNRQLEDNGISGTAIANPQNIYNLAAERGPSSFDIKLLNVTSVVYDMPVGRGRKYFANMNPVADIFFGGWQLTGMNTANTGEPMNVWYSPNGNNDVTGLATNAEYRGTAILRPNVSCTGSTSQSTRKPC